MQQPYAPRLNIPHSSAQHTMLGSPGAGLFASPASYGHLPFGGMVSPGTGGASPGGFFPPAHFGGGGQGMQFQGGGGVGLGLGAPPMMLQHSLAGSQAPSMVRSSSTSSNGSAATLPPTPASFGNAFYQHPHARQQPQFVQPQHSPQQQLFSPPLQPAGFSPSAVSAAPFVPNLQRDNSYPHGASSGPRGKLHASTPSFHPSQNSPFAGPPQPLSARPQHAGRTQSISVRPNPLSTSRDGALLSPTLSRTGSTSPGLSSSGRAGVGLASSLVEPKKKKMVVRFPREREEEDPVVVEGKPGRKLSTMRRIPLTGPEKEQRQVQMDRQEREVFGLEEDELVGRPVSNEEVKRHGLPETLEVFLPGKEAWEDVWDQFKADTTEKYGYCDLRKPSFLASSRPISFLNVESSHSGSPASLSGYSTPNPRPLPPGKHGRTASLFSGGPSSLPPRLQSVLDNLRRPGQGGHGSSLSLSFTSGLAALRASALSSPGGGLLSPGATSPGAVSPGSNSEGGGDPGSAKSRLTPLARSFTLPASSSAAVPIFPPPASLGVSAAEKTPLPSSPLPAGDEKDPLALAGAAISPVKPKRKPTLQELGRGFGIEEEEEDEGEHAAEESALQVDEEVLMSSGLVAVPVDREHSEGEAEMDIEEEVEDKGWTSTAPSRRTSTLTDRTGVASYSDFETDDDDEVAVKEATTSSDIEVNEVVEDLKEDITRSSDDTNPSLSIELSRALSDLGSISTGGVVPRASSTPPLPVLPALPAIEIRVDKEDEHASNASDWADGELSQSEYSNTSDEEDARQRAIVRARSSRSLRQDAFEAQQAEHNDSSFPGGGAHPMPSKPSGLLVDADVLFQAPSDVDLTDVEAGSHTGAKSAFQFPSPVNSPAKPKRGVQPDKVALPPSSPESLSSLAQPDLPPIEQFFRRSSLRIDAPEFTFGGRRASNASSTGPDDLAFGSFGHPGSLAASPSLPASTPPVTGGSLNPDANDFRPSFGIFVQQQSASTTSFGSGMGWGTAGKPGSIAASSPGFPNDEHTTPPQLNAFASEFKPSSLRGRPSEPTLSTELHRAFDFQPPSGAPLLPQTVEEQPRRASGSHGPLPPIPLTTVTPTHSASVKRQKVEGDPAWLPSAPPPIPTSSPMQRAVSSPQPTHLVHPQPRRPLPTPPVAHLQHLHGQAHRRFGAVDADQEEAELHRTTGNNSDVGNASLFSLDDPLPEQYAPVQPVVGSKARPSGAGRPFSLRAAPSFTSDGRVLGFQPVTPGGSGFRRRSPLPSFETPSDESKADRDRERENPSPARMGDPRVRHESVDMALPTSTRVKSKALPIPPERNGTGSDIFDDEAMPLTPVTDGERDSVVEVSGDENGVDEDDLPLRILEEIISSQFDGLKAELALLRPKKHDEDNLVDSFAARVELLLATSNLRSPAPADFADLVTAAHERTESSIVAALNRLQISTVSLPVPSPPRPLPSVPQPQLSLSAPATPVRPVTPALEVGPAAAYGAFLDDLRATVLPLAKQQVDVEVLVARLGALVQPQFDELFSRVEKQGKEESSAVVDELKALLDSFVGNVSKELEEKLAAATLNKAEEGRVESSSLTQEDKEVAARLASDVQAVKQAQEKILSSAVQTQDRLGQLGLDVTSRLESAYGQLEELIKAQAESTKEGQAAKIADLEIQLTKARNDHGKARSEKAVLSDRLDAEKARHAAEVSGLRKQVEALKDSLLEKMAAVAGAKGELEASKARTADLEEMRLVARKNVEIEEARRREREDLLAQQAEEIARLKQEVQDVQTGERERFKSLEKGLEKMKASVSKELDEAGVKINGLVDENGRLAEGNARLAALLSRYQQNGSGSTATVSHYHTPLAPSSLPNTPPAPPFHEEHDDDVYGFVKATALSPQHTGDSVGSEHTVAHTSFSPSPSVAGGFVRDDQGWYGAA
ncbi:hypothetical protein JCM8547_005876 [Rhodosporidiobolus lusitaniae]